MFDEILQRVGLKFEDLKKEERETLNTWVQSLQQNSLSMERVKDYIAAMRDAVEQELTETTHNTKQDIFLKARLRNYLLLEAFLSTPAKAKQALDNALAGLVGNVKK
jgi:hypothetical protein